MGFSTIFKYLGLAMETANQAAEVSAKLAVAKSADSPGGKEITEDELKVLIESLDENFSTVITRICQEAKLPVQSVKVEITV